MPEPQYPRRSEVYGLDRTTTTIRPTRAQKAALDLYKSWWEKTHGYSVSNETVLFTDLEQNNDKYREFLRAAEACPDKRSPKYLDCIKKQVKKGSTI